MIFSVAPNVTLMPFVVSVRVLWSNRRRVIAGNLTNLKTRSIIPVDLNALVYWNAKLLSEFYRELNVSDKALKYENIGNKWIEAVTAVLWHEEVGAWLDYDMLNEIKRDYFYPTNISPLWTGCYDSKKTEYFVSRTLKYLEKTQIMNNLGGIPTTLEHSGEQWDYPNAWPPLQYIMVMSLDNSGDNWAQDLAYEIAQRWMRSNYKAYNETNAMYEKVSDYPYIRGNNTTTIGLAGRPAGRGSGWVSAAGVDRFVCLSGTRVYTVRRHGARRTRQRGRVRGTAGLRLDQRHNPGVPEQVRRPGHGRGQVRAAADPGQPGQRRHRRRAQHQDRVVVHPSHDGRARDIGHNIGRMHRVR